MLFFPWLLEGPVQIAGGESLKIYFTTIFPLGVSLQLVFSLIFFNAKKVQVL